MNHSGYSPTERRPIASRNAAWAQRVATWLADRGVSPNAISVAGMIAAMLGGACLAGTQWPGAHVRWAWLAGAVLAQLRLLANLFDGMVAVHRQVASPMGELYNEVPDRVSDTALFVGLGYAAGGSPLWGWAAALVAVFAAYVRAAVKVAGAPQDYCGPMAKPQRMAVLIALGVYLAVAPPSWQPVREFGGHTYGLAAAALVVIALGGLLTAVRRLRRAAGRLQRQALP